jgi:hypothetical protein
MLLSGRGCCKYEESVVALVVVVVLICTMLVRAIDREMIEAQLHHFTKQTVLHFRPSRLERQGWPRLCKRTLLSAGMQVKLG